MLLWATTQDVAQLVEETSLSIDLHEMGVPDCRKPRTVETLIGKINGQSDFPLMEDETSVVVTTADED
ncbi:unnamed protein product [Schistocephalus solidus]|uniref:Reverse transcriptase n=1 Tax=Schistocephalus solidus TaxID=70667 RepID=A0A183T6N3_SCHSO|nr:unnamed protein product [Schistocephalus solidus]